MYTYVIWNYNTKLVSPKCYDFMTVKNSVKLSIPPKTLL